MKRLLVAGIAAAAFCGAPALAADMAVKAPPPPVAAPYNWGGFYVGGNVGGEWGSDKDPAFVSPNAYFGAANLALIDALLPVNLHQSGVTGGLQLGYNLQMSNFVVGVEGDFSALGGNAQRNNVFSQFGAGPTGAFLSDSSRANWFSSLRVRGGYAADRALFYATGGIAFSNWSIHHSYSDDTAGTPVPLTTDSTSPTRTGWVAGGGVEYAVTANWTARAEYLYADFGTSASLLSLPPPAAIPTVINHNDRLTQNILRLGVNYKFNGL
jgi:outer membrane immunogenic protein